MAEVEFSKNSRMMNIPKKFLSKLIATHMTGADFIIHYYDDSLLSISSCWRRLPVYQG